VAEDVPTRETRPVPDPTTLTTAALYREIAQLRELIEVKIGVLDTKVIGHFLIDAERFGQIDEQFALNERLRIEQKRDTQEALTAALKAQQDAVAKQDEANQKAISKSEITTGETLKKLEQLITVKTDALSEKIDDVKTTANGTVQQKVGATENRTTAYATIGLIVSIAVALTAIISFALAHAIP
jgi:hypothetical protein